jgi:hypothetical protein
MMWAERVGVYWYYSLILGNFNPTFAKEIYDNPAHVIAEAFVSQMAYNFMPSKE